MSKLGQNTLIASGNGSLSSVVDLRNFERYCVQITYGAGTATTAKLQASVNHDPDNGVTGTFVDIADSQQTLDNAGGSFVWNVNNAIYPWLKVVITGDSVTNKIFFAGDPVPRRG